MDRTARLRRAIAALAAGALLLAVLASVSLVVGPLPPGVVADAVLVEKSARRLTLLKDGKPLKLYRIALGFQPVGHKQERGDGRTPEGRYVIDGRNRSSAYHLALRISYPNVQDRARAAAKGVRPGGEIMIHGIRNGLGWTGRHHRFRDWTDGCIAVTNSEIEEIWRAVPDGTEVEIVP